MWQYFEIDIFLLIRIKKWPSELTFIFLRIILIWQKKIKSHQFIFWPHQNILHQWNNLGSEACGGGGFDSDSSVTATLHAPLDLKKKRDNTYTSSRWRWWPYTYTGTAVHKARIHNSNNYRYRHFLQRGEKLRMKLECFSCKVVPLVVWMAYLFFLCFSSFLLYSPCDVTSSFNFCSWIVQPSQEQETYPTIHIHALCINVMKIGRASCRERV